MRFEITSTQRRQGIEQVSPTGTVASDAAALRAIIDSPAVQEHAGVIVHEDLRGHPGTQTLCQISTRFGILCG